MHRKGRPGGERKLVHRGARQAAQGPLLQGDLCDCLAREHERGHPQVRRGCQDELSDMRARRICKRHGRVEMTRRAAEDKI